MVGFFKIIYLPFFVGGPPQQQWAPAVQGIPGCPQGLEYLTQIDQVMVKQQVDLIEGIFVTLQFALRKNVLRRK